MRYRPAMILLVILVATGVAAAALVATFFASRAELRAEIAKQAVVLAHTAATSIDADLNRRAVLARTFESTEYRAIERTLRTLRDAWRESGLDVSFVYTLVPDDSVTSGLSYAVDAEQSRDDKSPIGEAWKPMRQEGGHFDYRTPQAFEYTDRYGTFFSGFYPVTNQSGEVLFVVGVDLNGSLVNAASLRTVGHAAWPTAILAACAVLAAGFFGERLVRPLEGLRAFAERVGRGDLTAMADARAPGEAGGIARALNSTLASLRSTVRGADSTAARVREACDRLLESSDARHRSVNLTAERTADAARRATVIADLATTMAADATAATAAAQQTLEMGAQMMTDVADIDTGVRGVIDRGQELAESLKSMRERAATVDAALEAMVQVANRSSVLSLNAEIEANQAGPAGRGFAVVAREIRRLAEQAAANSLQIERNVARLHEALDKGARATEGFSTAAATASTQSARLLATLSEARRRLETLTPRLQAVGQHGEHFHHEGKAMRVGLTEAEAAARELHGFLGSFEETLVELRDRSAEVQGLLSHLRTTT